MGIVFLLIVYALPSGVVGLWERLRGWRPGQDTQKVPA
jgi:branched-chain amino acid transport system permease protein